jgi:hypothetical protein
VTITTGRSASPSSVFGNMFIDSLPSVANVRCQRNVVGVARHQGIGPMH